MTDPTPPPPPPAPPVTAQPFSAHATPHTPARDHLSYGQFLGRAVTAALVAPLGLIVATFAFFALIAGCAAVVSGASGSATDDGPISSTEHIDGVEGADNVILVVDVEGVILADAGGAGPFGGLLAGGDDIKEQLEAAADDSDVDAVILRLNTPGGSVVGSELISDGVAAVQAAGKPVVAHVTEISASGGMWAMAPADRIVASNGSLIGSIGVILGPLSRYTDVVAVDGGLLGSGVETTGGIDQFFITAGTGKDAGNPFRDLTTSEQEMFQALVDGSYDDFVDHVATNRSLDPSTITDELGAGVFTASDAVENGLVDETGNFDRAQAVAAELAGIVGDFDVREVTPDFGLLGFLFASNEPQPADVSGICSSTPTAHLYFGDLGAWCAQN
ncbi:MAG: S49 family peptidase [Ilumatobacter sp.]